jgi:2-aminoadipate transaminase
MPTPYASRMHVVQPSAVRELLRLGGDPDIVSFGGGYPDASLFPAEALNEIMQVALTENSREVLQYTHSNGIPKLREQLAARMCADGIACTMDNVLILHGAQQGLDLVARLFIDRGDLIAVENPTFLGGLLAFNPCEPRYLTAPIDAEGIDTAALEAVLRANPGVKLFYTVPDFQNPTGVTMSLARRKHLIELANRYDFVVIEDTPYREIRYEGESLPTLKSLDSEGRVIYLGTFSKILAPGLRLGWAVASKEIIEQLGLLKLAADTQCSTLNMHAVSMFLETQDLDVHIARLRAVYRRKKDVMIDAIQRTFPSTVRYTNPQGGLFTWLTFEDGFDTTRFMRERALPEAKVFYVPGATFFAARQETHHARLSYSTQPDETIVRGISALGQLLRGS